MYSVRTVCAGMPAMDVGRILTTGRGVLTKRRVGKMNNGYYIIIAVILIFFYFIFNDEEE
jgi:hypothetical protein